jgi:RNA-directed DNA polymerase
MHYAFDRWMDRDFPNGAFEHYADDAVIPCNNEAQARAVWYEIPLQLGSLGLELQPDKTKVVCCKEEMRQGEAEHTSFDFLGHTFRARSVLGKRGLFIGFIPAMGTKAMKAKGKQIGDWHLNRPSGVDQFQGWNWPSTRRKRSNQCLDAQLRNRPQPGSGRL